MTSLKYLHGLSQIINLDNTDICLLCVNAFSYTDKDMKWKQFYLKLVFLIGKMKEVYDFDFSSGDPEQYYEILKGSKSDQFFIASKLHLLDLLTYLIVRENKVVNNWDYRNLLDWGIFGSAVGGHEDLVNHYLEYNADINTALAGAVQGGNIELAKKIIQKGADDFDRALYNSGVKERRNMVDFLLQYGGNINEVLVGAADQNASREFIDFLIGRGANIQQAINMAEHDKNDEALEYLRKL